MANLFVFLQRHIPLNIMFRLLLIISASLFAALPALGQICSTDPNLNIPDGSGSAGSGGPASITIDVPAFYTNAITDLTFDVQVNHTYVGDLIITLQSPSGTVVTLMDRPGVPASTFGCSQNNVAATFDDASGIPVETQCPAATPTIAGVLNPQGSLSDFDGEIPAGTWTLTVTDNAGQDTGSIISAANCLDLTTVPVVLSSFKSKQRGQRLNMQWQTASEAFNLGFNLWGNLDGEWTQLNNRLIPSHTVDSVEPQHYRRKINLNKLASQPTHIGISSVSSSGFEEFYGPFEVGENYGELTVPEAIDWSEQRAQHAQTMRNNGFEFRHNRWRKKTQRSEKQAARLQQRFSDLWLRIEETGVYRITHQDLVAQGIDLSGLPIKHLALSQAGKPIARIVSNPNPSKNKPGKRQRFGEGSEIIFYAQTPNGEQARYVDYTNIRLSADISKALNAQSASELLDVDGAVSRTHIQRVNFGKPNGYSFIIPGYSPWYDEVIYAFGDTGTKVMSFDVEQSADLNAPVNIELNLMGGTSFDNVDNDGDGVVEPDHHFKVYLNRDEFSAPIYEGYSEKVDAIHVQISNTGQLKHGSNSIEIEVIPDNGHNLDALYFLNAQAAYQVANSVNGTHNKFELLANQEWVQVNDASNIERVFVYDSANNFAEVNTVRTAEQLVFKAPSAIGESTQRTAWLASTDGYLSPTEISTVPSLSAQSLDLTDINYVIIAAPSLIGADLERFAHTQRELGRHVKIVSAHDIYTQYADGLEIPSAIAQYLKDAASNTTSNNGAQTAVPLQYALLVGGHTYNYRGYNSTPEDRPINLIPSFYRNGESSINRQIPTAVPFVDFNNDGLPELAIGRWPVRNLEQLNSVVNKTIAWHQDGSNKSNRHALFVAQQDEELNNFSASLERLKANVGHISQPWPIFNQVYFSEILADNTVPDNEKVATARKRLIDGINQGPALTVYSGHASPTTWGKQNLLTTSVVDEFTNADSPTLIIPLACYTTYYETPNVKSLSERLFTDNQAGAVGISGPALLSYASNNERFAKSLLGLMTQQGHDLGTAVMLAKNALRNSGERGQTVVYNWVTLADPTLNFASVPIDTPPPSDDEKKNPAPSLTVTKQ